MAVLAPVVLVAPAVVFADGRVALVVGNGTYTHIGRLLNPDNDARDRSAALRRLGFEVTTELDADRVEQNEALRTSYAPERGQASLGSMYRDGRGVERNDREAIGWFRRSADRGNSCGQAYLGRMDVRERSGRAAGSRGSRSLVSSGSGTGRFVGAGITEESPYGPILHVQFILLV